MHSNIAAEIWGWTVKAARPFICQQWREEFCEWRKRSANKNTFFICFCEIYSAICEIYLFFFFLEGWNCIIYRHKLHAINFTHTVLCASNVFGLRHVYPFACWHKERKEICDCILMSYHPVLHFKSMYMWEWERAKQASNPSSRQQGRSQRGKLKKKKQKKKTWSYREIQGEDTGSYTKRQAGWETDRQEDRETGWDK